MKLSRITLIIVFFKIGLFYVHPISAQENKLTLDGLGSLNLRVKIDKQVLDITSDFANDRKGNRR